MSLPTKEMKLYLISRSTSWDYDTYSDAVVAATSPREARWIHPESRRGLRKWEEDGGFTDTWVEPEDVKVKYIGEAKKGTKEGVICASFHAG